MTELSAMHGEIVERLRRALATRDFGHLEPVLAKHTRFGTCLGPPQVVQWLQQFAQRTPDGPVQVETLADRVIATLAAGATAPGDQPDNETVAVLFVQDGRVEELQFVAGREQARNATLTPPPAPWPGEPTRMNQFAAVLPVRNLAHALEHYRLLGFEVSAYSGGGYGYGKRDGLDVHFSVVADLEPMHTTSAVYIDVDDADALFAEWRASGVSGQFHEPRDTDYGVREGAHVDLDGNLLRFGSRLSPR